MAPDPSAPHHCFAAHTSRPRAAHEPDCLADTSVGTSCPVPSVAPADLRLRRPPEGDRRPGLTRRPPPVSRWRSPTRRCRRPPKGPTARSEVAVNTVQVPIPLSPRERCGLGRSPLLTAPVGVRSPERGSVKTLQNPWSTPLSKNTGLSTKLLRYPQVSLRRPLVAHRSCTPMCTGLDTFSAPRPRIPERISRSAPHPLRNSAGVRVECAR